MTVSINNRKTQQVLDNILVDHSYLCGYTPSCTDHKVFEELKEAPPGDLFNLCRWFRHINSFDAAERNSWTGEKKTLIELGCSEGEATVNQGGDDDIDLFASDEETEEEKRIKQERLRMYEEKKAGKSKPAAKSSIVFDVKPYDDETDLKHLESRVRAITMEGLVWGEAKYLPIAYGIKKLQILCVVEDEKVSTDDLEEEITSMDDMVQSVDIVSFNKI
ncbi:hypothetical protein GJ496_006361 [Pomphorhynchus laevis]|nr:hypothetical protein GJ496_006361 [Pomphorhynchus laevis]